MLLCHAMICSDFRLLHYPLHAVGPVSYYGPQTRVGLGVSTMDLGVSSGYKYAGKNGRIRYKDRQDIV